jgi:hypothetical protein
VRCYGEHVEELIENLGTYWEPGENEQKASQKPQIIQGWLVKTGLLVGSWFLLEPWGPGLGFSFHKEEGLLALSLINIF